MASLRPDTAQPACMVHGMIRYDRSNISDLQKQKNSLLLREVIQKKSCFLSDIVQPESKSFEVVFFGLSFGHFGGKGGGLNLFQKFWGSFEVVLR